MTERDAIEFFGLVFGGEHRISGSVKPFGRGWKINCYDGLSTFDDNRLTRLVFLAHDRCVRVEILQGGPGRLGIAIWQRGTREGDIMTRHPTLETAIEDWRTKHPTPGTPTAGAGVRGIVGREDDDGRK